MVLPPEHFPVETDRAEQGAATVTASPPDAALSGIKSASTAPLPNDLATASIDPSPAQASSHEAADITLPISAPAMPPLAQSEAQSPVGGAEGEQLDAAPLLEDGGAGVKSEPVDYGTQYIDPTDYSLGATEPEVGPDVVLTERSTGCKTVLRPGDGVPQSLCGTNTNGTNAGATAQSPSQPSSRSGPLPAVNAVRVGAITIDGQGIRLRRSVRDYYNRTARPKALRGNNNQSLMFPLAVPARISSPFGWRIHPIFGNHRLHTGTDFAVPQGTPVIAAFSGQVALSDILGGYGVTVVLQHDERSAQTLYGHLSEVFVKSGEWVEQGTVIGRVGSTGNSTGPHLHFEYRQRTAAGWSAVNAGQMLQQALNVVGGSFQLTEITLSSGIEIPQLSIPKLLRSGKDATKEFSESTLVSLPPTPISIANISAPEVIDP